MTPINATKYCNIERGSGNCDEARRFTYWRNRCQHEPNPGTVGEPNSSTAGYQEGKR